MPVRRVKQFIESGLGVRGGIVRSAGILISGTAFAQALAILALPLLTRLYTPADFNVLAVYASTLGMLAGIACLRLEIAIPLPEDDCEAASLLALALTSCVGFTLLVCAVAFPFPSQIAAWLKMPAFAQYLWMVPVGVWLAGTYSALQFWFTRKKRFGFIARTRMGQTMAGVCVQAGAGLAIFGPVGLLLGQMINGGAGIIGLARVAWRLDGSLIRAVTLNSMRRALARHSRFPKYAVIDALANNAGTHLPIIIIAVLAIGPDAGFLTLASRIMFAPMALIGGAVAQVYLSQASDHLRAGTLADNTAGIITGLAKSGLGPLVYLGIVAVPVFEITFGTEWRRAGEFVTWMTPWFILQFLSSPVSMVMYVTGRQKLMLLLTLWGGAVRILAALLAGLYWNQYVVEVFALTSAIVYAIYLRTFVAASGVTLGRLLNSLKPSFPFFIVWVAMAFLTLQLI